MRREVQEPLLERGQAVEPVTVEPPAPLGIAAPGAASGAGRVDQHEVCPVDPLFQRGKLVRRVQKPRLDPGAGPPGPGFEAAEARAIAVGG